MPPPARAGDGREPEALDPYRVGIGIGSRRDRIRRWNVKVGGPRQDTEDQVVRLSRSCTGIVGTATAAVAPGHAEAGPGKDRGCRTDRGGALSRAPCDRVVHADRDRGLGEALLRCGEACKDDRTQKMRRATWDASGTKKR